MIRLTDALADFDLGALGRDLQTASLHQDRCRRHAERIAIPADCPETRRAAANIDVTVAALSSAERLVALLGRFLADEGSGRPQAVKAARATPLAMRRPGSVLGPMVVMQSAEGR
ncbi:hypothetical protein QA634_20705 [Methylobacterium sp. CB376]|uniref:hypothetical protein n=1 Tax=unclassified Methylobacterium TaxID=2615210 RepID=UPI0002DEFDF8|nr:MULTISPECIES: hypothetical protein [Methylobacterium]WFT83749.1 hypothetical protein QA634_20705 [Methylobacterium nodulans]